MWGTICHSLHVVARQEHGLPPFCCILIPFAQSSFRTMVFESVRPTVHTLTLVCELASKPEFGLAFVSIVATFSRKTIKLRYLPVDPPPPPRHLANYECSKDGYR